ncbi:hypothetical protein B5K05_28455 [Rhizobium phaseoli]|nr:hypothetical protein B5K05_28455 [Rhizobium phaseoli]
MNRQALAIVPNDLDQIAAFAPRRRILGCLLLSGKLAVLAALNSSNKDLRRADEHAALLFGRESSFV